MFTRTELIRVAISFGIRTGAVLLGAVVACVLSIGQIEQVTDRIKAQNELAIRLETQTELLNAVSSQQDTLGVNASRIKEAFVPTENILDFVSAIESTASRFGLTQTYRFENPGPAPSYKPPMSSVAFTVDLTANNETLASYLRAFEALPYFTRFDSVSLGAQTGVGWKNSSSVNLHGVVFTRQE